MATSEFWLYTCIFPETSCITALEMLMSGVIPIYYSYAGLPYTINGNGIQTSQGNEINDILKLNENEENKKLLVKKGIEYAQTCSWELRAREWEKILFKKEHSLKSYNFEFKDNIIKEPNLEIKEYIQNWHNNFNIQNDHINFLKKLEKEFKPNVIYDIGANVLHWTREARKIWSNSEIIVFDAIQDMEFFYKEHNLKYSIGVLSDEDNKIVKFYGNTYTSGGNSYYKEIGSSKSNEIYPEDLYTEYKTNTLLSVVVKNNFKLPDLVKIDVQGAELDIIKGGLNIINNAKFLIVELQNTQYNRGAPLADVTIKFLENNNWELISPKFCDNGPDADYCFKNKKYV